MIVISAPGGSIIATETTAKAPPDGYTILMSNTPQEFTAYIKTQIARFAQVVKATGMRAD